MGDAGVGACPVDELTGGPKHLGVGKSSYAQRNKLGKLSLLVMRVPSSYKTVIIIGFSGG